MSDLFRYPCSSVPCKSYVWLHLCYNAKLMEHHLFLKEELHSLIILGSAEECCSRQHTPHSAHMSFISCLNKYKSPNEVELKIVFWVRSIFPSLIAYSAINSWFSFVFTQRILWVEKITSLSPASPQIAGCHPELGKWFSGIDKWRQQHCATLRSLCFSVILPKQCCQFL